MNTNAKLSLIGFLVGSHIFVTSILPMFGITGLVSNEGLLGKGFVTLLVTFIIAAFLCFVQGFEYDQVGTATCLNYLVIWVYLQQLL